MSFQKRALTISGFPIVLHQPHDSFSQVFNEYYSYIFSVWSPPNSHFTLRSMKNLFNRLLSCLCIADIVFLTSNILVVPFHFGLKVKIFCKGWHCIALKKRLCLKLKKYKKWRNHKSVLDFFHIWNINVFLAWKSWIFRFLSLSTKNSWYVCQRANGPPKLSLAELYFSKIFHQFCIIASSLVNKWLVVFREMNYMVLLWHLCSFVMNGMTFTERWISWHETDETLMNDWSQLDTISFMFPILESTCHFALSASIFLIITITIERWQAVCFPFSYQVTFVFLNCFLFITQ